jgi:hypothetical protein
MNNNLTNYQIEAQEKYGNLTYDKKKSIEKMNTLKQYRIGKQFTKNTDTTYTDTTYKAPGNDFDIITEHYQNVERPEQLAQEVDKIQDEDAMEQVRSAWRRHGELYNARLHESIRNEKAAQAKTFSDVLTHARKDLDVLTHPRENPVLESIKSLTKTKKGGKTRVFRKKSAKKVSRRNRRSRNIRRNRRSRAHKRK